MKKTDLYQAPRGKRGSGRKATITNILIPKEVKNMLRQYKDAYGYCFSEKKDKNGNPIPIRISYEQMLRRWMKQVQVFDPDVSNYLDSQQPVDQTFCFDLNTPSDTPIEYHQFVFKRDSEMIEALVGDHSPFYAKVNGREIGYKEMIQKGYVLFDIDSCTEIIEDEVDGISNMIQFMRAFEANDAETTTVLIE